MPYLIDGHNLIPRLGLSLRAADDELQLIARLQAFCRVRRKQVEVYFDGAPPGQAGTRTVGPVTAHFVRQGSTADEAIRRRLHRLGRAARNWIVVSSDHAVQAAARAVGAQALESEAFAAQVIEAAREAPATATGNGKLSAEEVEAWLKVFREKKR